MESERKIGRTRRARGGRTILGIGAALLVALLPSVGHAQEPGKPEDAPPLTIENVTVVGKRVVVLPAARKGEVIDTSIYLLPPGDTLMFGQRVSNLASGGGALPEMAEFTSPAHLGFEASLGTYLSPHALLRGEYIRRSYDLAGLVEYRGTAGYVDGSEASSLLVDANGGFTFGGDDPVLGRARASGEFELLGDSYNLFGFPIPTSTGGTRFIDRGRTVTSFGASLASGRGGPGGVVDYDVHFRLTDVSVRDADADSSRTATATTPNIGMMAGVMIDSVHASVEAEYATTSLHYTLATQTPSIFSVRARAEWRPGASLLLAGGVLYAGGQSSDSGSTTLAMPFASLRYDLSPAVALFAAFEPELRTPSYRDRIMSAPYVDREITLRPERVDVSLSGGARLRLDPATLGGRFFYRSAENTPVVVAADTPMVGWLQYEYTDSRSVGLAADFRWHAAQALDLSGDAVLQSAVATGTNHRLPMTPDVDVRLRGDFILSPSITIFGTAAFQSAQAVSLDSTLPDLGSRFILGAGGAYKILSSLEAFAEVTNLTNGSYELWRNYQAPGLELRAGIRGTF